MDEAKDKTEEESWAANNEKYHLLFELESDALFLIDNETGNILETNRAASELYGFSHSQLLTMKHTDLSAEPQETKRFSHSGQTFVPVRWHLKNDGTIFPVEISARHFVWKGRPTHIAAVRDISERFRAEEALRENEERYRSLFDHNPDGVYLLEMNGAFARVNEACCRMTGYSRKELLEMGFSPLIDLDDVESVWQHFERAKKGEPQNYEAAIVRKNGERVELDVTNTPIIMNGEITGVYGIAKDITKRKQAEQALRDSELRYKFITEKMTDIVWMQDMNLRTIFVSPSIGKALGFTPEERVAQDVTKQLTPSSLTVVLDTLSQELALEHQGQADPERKITIEVEYYHKDGSTRWYENIISGIRDDKELLIGLHGVSRDITKRKQAENAHNKSFSQLRRAMGSIIHAIAGVVEVRDPYTAGHQRRVSDLARYIATEMNLSHDQIEGIRTAASIHDLGKVAIPAEILSKPAILTSAELSLIKVHPQVGYDILMDIEFPWPIARIVLEHHERMDGSGYPNGVTGDKLLIESRIMAVADVVEAIASHRPYRPGRGIEKALEEIEMNKGRLYDVDAVDACIRLFREKSFHIKFS